MSRYQLDEGFGPQTISRAGEPRPRPRRDRRPPRPGPRPCCCSPCPGRPTSTRARSWACPRSPTCPPRRGQDPRFRRTHGAARSAATAAACRCPGPGPARTSASPTTALAQRRPGSPSRSDWGALQRRGAARRPGFVPQPVPDGPAAAPRAPGPRPRHAALARQTRRRRRPALLRQGAGLHLRREPRPSRSSPLPPHREILLASEPDAVGSDGSLRPDTAVWLSA